MESNSSIDNRLFRFREIIEKLDEFLDVLFYYREDDNSKDLKWLENLITQTYCLLFMLFEDHLDLKAKVNRVVQYKLNRNEIDSYRNKFSSFDFSDKMETLLEIRDYFNDWAEGINNVELQGEAERLLYDFFNSRGGEDKKEISKDIFSLIEELMGFIEDGE